MTSAIGEASTSKSMGFDKDDGSQVPQDKRMAALQEDFNNDEPGEKYGRQMSETSLYATEEEEEEAEGNILLGPQFTLKEQLEKDKVRVISFIYCIFGWFSSLLDRLSFTRMTRACGGGRSSFLGVWILILSKVEFSFPFLPILKSVCYEVHRSFMHLIIQEFCRNSGSRSKDTESIDTVTR